MKIHTLEIENFGIIKKVFFTFNDGINLILGDNGNGKSFVLKAISFLLINYIEKTIADYCNWFKDFYVIKMEMEHMGRIFKFNYRYEKKTDKIVRELYIDKEYYKNKDAVDILATYFDPSLCKSSIISFQGKIDLVDSKPAERREGLKKIYNLNFTTQIEEASAEIKDLVENKLSGIKNQIFALKNMEYNYHIITDLPFKEIKKIQLEKDLISLKAMCDIYTTELKEYESLQQQIKEVESSISLLNNNIVADNNKLLEFDRNKENLDKEYSEKVWETNLIFLEKELEGLTCTRPPNNHKMDIQVIDDKIIDYTVELKHIETMVEASKNDKCPTCERYFKSRDKEVYRERLDNIIEKLHKENEDKNALQELQNDYEKVLTENKEIENRRKLLKSKIDAEEKSIIQGKQILQKDIDLWQEKINNIKERVKNYRDDLNTKTTKLEQLSKLLGDKPTIEEEIDDKIISISGKIENYNKIDSENTWKTKENDKIKLKEKEDKKKLKKYILEQGDIQNKIDRFKRYKIILQKEFPNFVINQMTGSIEEGINNIVNMVYNGRYRVKIIKTKSGIDVVYGDKEASISVASGFEKELFNLGYKHAFSKMSNLKILILDEVDSFASEENSEKLFHAIGELKDLYNQVFIVTHKSNVQEILMRDYEATCYLMENGKSSIF